MIRFQEAAGGATPMQVEVGLPENGPLLIKIFSYFFPPGCSLIYMRGVLAEFSPGSLVDLIQPGDSPSVVNGRGNPETIRGTDAPDLLSAMSRS